MVSKSFVKPLLAFVAGAALLGGAFLNGRAATGVHTLAPAPYPPAQSQSPYPPAQSQSPYPPAQSQSPYPPAQSQSQPPLVWVNTQTCVYHYPGSRWYGVTREGKYVTEAQAVAEGDRPSQRD